MYLLVSVSRRDHKSKCVIGSIEIRFEELDVWMKSHKTLVEIVQAVAPSYMDQVSCDVRDGELEKRRSNKYDVSWVKGNCFSENMVVYDLRMSIELVD